MNIVGVAKTDIFSACIFNNIVGVAFIFYFPFFTPLAPLKRTKYFCIIYIHFLEFPYFGA
jgi:hypothetical protein